MTWHCTHHGRRNTVMMSLFLVICISSLWCVYICIYNHYFVAGTSAVSIWWMIVIVQCLTNAAPTFSPPILISEIFAVLSQFIFIEIFPLFFTSATRFHFFFLWHLSLAITFTSCLLTSLKWLWLQESQTATAIVTLPQHVHFSPLYQYCVYICTYIYIVSVSA